MTCLELSGSDAMLQFMAWDTFSRRRIDLVGRQDDGDKVIAHEFDFSVRDQLIYSRNGVNITSTPVRHYETDGPVALRLDWNRLSVTYSGIACTCSQEWIPSGACNIVHHVMRASQNSLQHGSSGAVTSVVFTTCPYP